MRHCDNVDNIGLDAINQAVAKALEVATPQAGAHGVPSVRILQDHAPCLRDFEQKALAQARLLQFQPKRRLVQFAPRRAASANRKFIPASAALAFAP